MHWVIMTYSEKLSEIKALGKGEVYHTKIAKIDFALAETEAKKGHDSVKI